MNTQRDKRGRFIHGNTISSSGGKARAQALSKRRRRQIAKAGRRALVEKHFASDDRCQREYFAALGRFNYEQMADVENFIHHATKHPGTPSEWGARYWQLELLNGPHLDINFYSDGGQS